MRESSNAMRLCCNACISDKEEGGTNAKDDTNAAANNAAPNDNNYTTMPPKLKPPPRKLGTKKTKGESDDVAAMPTPAPKPPETSLSTPQTSSLSHTTARACRTSLTWFFKSTECSALTSTTA